MKLKLKPFGTKRLKLKSDILLSTSAVKFNLHRYVEAAHLGLMLRHCEGILAKVSGANQIYTAALGASFPHFHAHMVPVYEGGRGLHSSTFRLNLSTCCGTGEH